MREHRVSKHGPANARVGAGWEHPSTGSGGSRSLGGAPKRRRLVVREDRLRPSRQSARVLLSPQTILTYWPSTSCMPEPARTAWLATPQPDSCAHGGSTIDCSALRASHSDGATPPGQT